MKNDHELTAALIGAGHNDAAKRLAELAGANGVLEAKLKAYEFELSWLLGHARDLPCAFDWDDSPGKAGIDNPTGWDNEEDAYEDALAEGRWSATGIARIVQPSPMSREPRRSYEPATSFLLKGCPRLDSLLRGDLPQWDGKSVRQWRQEHR